MDSVKLFSIDIVGGFFTFVSMVTSFQSRRGFDDDVDCIIEGVWLIVLLRESRLLEFVFNRQDPLNYRR